MYLNGVFIHEERGIEFALLNLCTTPRHGILNVYLRQQVCIYFK